MTPDKNESPLSRWSRRKLESREAEDNRLTALADDDNPGIAPAPEAEAEAPVVLTDADMPAIDSLTEESDFSGFMSSGVSDKLRNLALRKLFNAPEFNIRDGLDEYDEDYTYFEKLGDIVTCDMKHQIEMEEKERLEARQKELEASEGDSEGIEDDDSDIEVAAVEEEDGQSGEQPGAVQPSDQEISTPPASHDEK